LGVATTTEEKKSREGDKSVVVGFHSAYKFKIAFPPFQSLRPRNKIRKKIKRKI